MGRGNRGGGGRSGRGGRRGASGAAGGRHGQGRHGQSGAAPPTGEALVVELRATPEFHDALKEHECPAGSLEGGSGAVPMGVTHFELGHWKDLGPLIAWFRDGIAADPLAELTFSPRLTKALRASVHGTATAVGLGGLGTVSRGVGEERRVVVMARARAEKPVLDEKQDHKAFWVYRWAQQAGLQVSRDEAADMVLGDGLTPELQALWEAKAAQQKGVQQLCGAAAAGDVAAAEAALTAQPSLLADKVFDVESGVAPLHVAAREGQVAALELLLARGAHPDAKDGHGWTALQVARKFDQSDAEGALLRAGARDPDAGKSLVDRLPAAGKQQRKAAAAAAETAPIAAPERHGNGSVTSFKSAAAGSEAAAEADSAASVCGTERDGGGADVSSNADDYADPQYQAGGSAFEAVEEGDEGSSLAALPAGPPAAPVAAEQQQQQAPAGAAAAGAAAAAEAAKEEEEEEEDWSDGDTDEEEGALAEAAAGFATRVAINAFTVAVAAAEAAEAAAEEAERLGGAEGAARASAFRRESEAAVAAAAAAAVAAGDSLDHVLTPANSGSVALASPALELLSNESVYGSDVPRGASLASELGAAGSAAGSAVGSAAAESAPSATSAALGSPLASAALGRPAGEATVGEAQAGEGRQQEEQPVAAAARSSVDAAAEAALATGGAAAAAGLGAPAGSMTDSSPAGKEGVGLAPGQPVEVAAKEAAHDVRDEATGAAEQAAAATRSAAAAAGSAASAAYAELQARLPEWTEWVQEHPGSVAAGAGVAAALAALLLLSRRR